MRARKSAAASRSGALRHPVAHEVGRQERGHQRVGLVRLDRQPGQEDVGLGDQDPLQHLVLDARHGGRTCSPRSMTSSSVSASETSS